MAHKEPVKKAAPLPGGGLQWAWNGSGKVSHIVSWHKDGKTFWSVMHDGVTLRTEMPWFLVETRGEVQENIRHFRNANLDRVHANRALLACGIMPDQHIDGVTYCNCGPCQGINTI